METNMVRLVSYCGFRIVLHVHYLSAGNWLNISLTFFIIILAIPTRLHAVTYCLLLEFHYFFSESCYRFIVYSLGCLYVYIFLGLYFFWTTDWSGWALSTCGISASLTLQPEQDKSLHSSSGSNMVSRNLSLLLMSFFLGNEFIRCKGRAWTVTRYLFHQNWTRLFTQKQEFYEAGWLQSFTSS